jgi:hypothetical protein
LNRTALWAFLLLAALAHPARADLVIRGEAAEALRCATVIQASLVVLQRFNLVSPADVRLGGALAGILLDKVPGTRRQKTQAMQIMGKRLMQGKTPDQILQTFRTDLKRCGDRFF